MVYTLGSFVLFASAGFALTYLFEERAPLSVRVSGGACIVTAFAALICFLLACSFGLTATTIGISTTIAGLPLLLFTRSATRNMAAAEFAALVSKTRQSPLVSACQCLAFFAFGALVVSLFLAGMFETNDGIYTALLNNVGDLPFHLRVITGFAWGGNLPPEHPLYAGAKFAYPFLPDFLSAMFVASGASLRDSMLVPSVVCCLAMFVLLKRWTAEITGDRLASSFAVLLTFLSGGLGWYVLFSESIHEIRSDGVGFLLQLPHDYTIRGDTVWRWGNVITTLFIPQRSFSVGAALTLYIWRLWRLADAIPGEDDAARRGLSNRRLMIAAAAISGLLPLVHTHSFLVVIVAAMFFTIGTGLSRDWLIYAVVVTLISAPQLLWIAAAGTVNSSSYLQWHFGWDHGSTHPLLFWFVNTGAFIPLLICTIALQFTPRPLMSSQAVGFYIPFAVLFFLANMIKLAPWVWDNIKVLFYWFLASVPLVARFLALLYRRNLLLRSLSTLLLLSMTLAGALDLWRLLTRTSTYREFDPDGIRIAAFLRNNARPRSVVLHAPVYNSPVFLSGGRTLLGFTGTLWTHGIRYEDRERDIRSIYTGAVEAVNLISRYDVDFILVGPHERRYIEVNEQFLSKYMTVAESGKYRVYATAPTQKGLGNR